MRFFEQVFDVYFDDLDPFHILHNSRYLLMFERTIGGFWQSLGFGGPLDFAKNPDQSQLVRANHLEYLRPVVGQGRVRARIWVEKLGTTSLTFGFRLLAMDEDADHARGTRTMVRVDPDTKRPAPWSEALRARLAPYRRDLDEPDGP